MSQDLGSHRNTLEHSSNRSSDALGSPHRRTLPTFVEEAPSPAPFSLGVLWHRLGTVAVCLVLGALLAYAVAQWKAPVYRATATLELHSRSYTALRLAAADSNTPMDLSAMDAYIQTQLVVLRSRALRRRVAAKLGIVAEETASEKPKRLHERVGLWLGSPPAPASERIRQALNSVEFSATRSLAMIRVSGESSDSALAARVVNAFVDEYVDQHDRSRLESGDTTNRWMNSQTETLRRQLETAESRLRTYAERYGLVFTGESSIAEERLRKLQDDLERAQVERFTAQSRYDLTGSSPLEALGEVLDNGAMREYLVRLTDLRRQAAEQGSLLTPRHYKMQQLQAQIAELEASVMRERANIVRRLRNDYTAAQQREQLLRAEYAAQMKTVGQQANRSVEYNLLKREVETHRQLYDLSLQRMREVGITSALPSVTVRVIDAAEPAREPVRPHKALLVLLGAISGGFVGAGLAFWREARDCRLRTPGELSTYLQLPELGIIPSQRSDPSLPKPARWLTGPDADQRIELVSWRHSDSMLAESFRSTMTSILFSTPESRLLRSVVVTSPSAGEGKTTAVTNLGIALARANRRVLLVDGDLRRPRLHRILDLPASPGLRGLLDLSGADLDRQLTEAARSTAIPNLFVLPAGIEECGNAEILASWRIVDVLRAAELLFDFVLIDTPPLLDVADARVWGRMADGVVLVIRSGETDRQRAARAAERLIADGILLIGTLLNGWDPRMDRYGSAYASRYAGYTPSPASAPRTNTSTSASGA